VRFIPNSGVLSMEKTPDGKVNVKVLKRREGEYEGGEEERIAADRVISCCGFRPNDGLWSQLQVHQCYASSAPMKLAGGDEPHFIAPWSSHLRPSTPIHCPMEAWEVVAGVLTRECTSFCP
jgi:hypothetical protein